jgi:hypothetical protein
VIPKTGARKRAASIAENRGEHRRDNPMVRPNHLPTRANLRTVRELSETFAVP